MTVLCMHTQQALTLTPVLSRLTRGYTVRARRPLDLFTLVYPSIIMRTSATFM